MILCCKCGIPIEPKLMNMCNRCITTEITISSKVKRNMVMEHCRGCGRYLCPPRSWMELTWGSKEFLLFLIKKNKSLNGLCIVDSSFVCAEQSSKRIVFSLTIQINGIEQLLEIKCVIKNMQCFDCSKTEAKQFWNNLVQVRHKAGHKRMFMYLEHLILRNNVYEDMTNIKQRKEGLDFYYSERPRAIRMVNFLQNILPVKVKTSERLISKDTHTNKSNYKFCYSVEIVPLCKDDLIVVDRQVASSIGVGALLIVQNVATSIMLLDPKLMKTVKIMAKFYWKNKDKFKVLMSSPSFKKYEVVIKENTGIENEEYSSCDLTVTEDGSAFFETRSHLGRTIHERDVVFGYDLLHSNLITECEEKVDMVLIRKVPILDVEWKIQITAENNMEYRLFVEDIKDDERMMQNIGVVNKASDVLDNSFDRFTI